MREYRFAGPRAEWKKLAEWPSGSQLESYGVNPAWLDQIFTHPDRGGIWRVEGLHPSYRSIKQRPLVIVSTKGEVATMWTTRLRKILENNPPALLDMDRD